MSHFLAVNHVLHGWNLRCMPAQHTVFIKTFLYAEYYDVGIKSLTGEKNKNSDLSNRPLILTCNSEES